MLTPYNYTVAYYDKIFAVQEQDLQKKQMRTAASGMDRRRASNSSLQRRIESDAQIGMRIDRRGTCLEPSRRFDMKGPNAKEKAYINEALMPS